MTVDPISWDAIAKDPSSFYNIKAFAFPVKLKDPASYSLGEAFTLTEWLQGNCGIDSGVPFQFSLDGAGDDAVGGSKKGKTPYSQFMAYP